MKGTFEVNISTAEGIGSDLSSVGCYISIDGRLYDVLTPLSNPGPDATIKLPETGELRLIIKNMGGNDHVFGSVSLPLDLLPQEPTRLWLPLFDHLDGDLLHAIPTDVEPPRVLLVVGNPSPLSPVPEMTERSETDEFECDDIHKTASEDPRKSKCTELQHQLEILNWKLKVEEDLHKEEVTALRAHIAERNEDWVRCSQKHAALAQDLTSQVGAMQKLFSQEKKQTEVLTEKVNCAKEELEAWKGKWNERERKLCEEVTEKEGENGKLREEICALQGEIRRMEGERVATEEARRALGSHMDNSTLAELQEALDLAVEQLADSEIQRKLLQDELLKASQYSPPPPPTNDSLKSFLLAEIESLHNQLQATETELAECQDQGGRLSLEVQRRLQAETELQQSNSALLQAKDTILSLSQENDTLKKELQEFVMQLRESQSRYEDLHALSTLLKTERVKLTNDFDEYRKRIPESDVIDWLLARFFSERGLLGPLQRLNEGLYSFNNKKFVVVLRGAGLVVRVGSGMLPLEGFLKIYMPMEVKHLEQSSRSQSVEVMKRHRRVNTMPENVTTSSRRKLSEDEGDSSTNNTSQTDLMKPVPELDFENSMEVANRPARTPSPKRKQMHNTSINQSKVMSKTPKTPNRSMGGKKSVDKGGKRVPFR